MTRKPPDQFPPLQIFFTRLSDRGPPNPAGSLALVSRSPWGEGRTSMSQISRGIFAAIAVSLTLGAVPLALGRDLYGAQDKKKRWAVRPGPPSTARTRPTA